MFSFFKSKPSIPIGYYPITADMHSHILPGIDDGSPDVQTSVQLVKGMMAMGITKATATPHIIGDLYRNNAETISGALDQLRTGLQNENIDFEVSAAAEYMLDSYFFELLSNKTPILTVKDNLVLTEFSYSSMPANPEKMSFAIITEGYTPILAHPERYAYYHNNYRQYHELNELGFLLQVNLLSLTGYYGKETAKAARYLIRNGLVSFAGTDMHHERHLAALNNPKSIGIFLDVFAGTALNNAAL